MREKKWLGPKICFLVGGATYFWIKRWNGSKTKVVLKWGGGNGFWDMKNTKCYHNLSVVRMKKSNINGKYFSYNFF